MNIIIKIVTARQFYVTVITLIVCRILNGAGNKALKKFILKNDSKSIEQKRKLTIVNLAQNVAKYFVWIITRSYVLFNCWCN